MSLATTFEAGTVAGGGQVPLPPFEPAGARLTVSARTRPVTATVGAERTGERHDRQRASVTAARRYRLARHLLTALACACLPVACGTSHKARQAPTTEAGPRPTVATTSTTGPTRYTVARGDTLTAIARRFRVAVAAVAAANHLTNLNDLTPGQVLVIPPAQPVRLVIRPPQGTLGGGFTFSLTGAKPDELVLFEIVRPDGGKFVGPPHIARPDGSVSTTYLTVFGDALGRYKVLAAGNEGTVARADFQVVAPPSSTTA
jgi:LysM repeat protein